MHVLRVVQHPVRAAYMAMPPARPRGWIETRIEFLTLGHSSAASMCPASTIATTSRSPSASVAWRWRGPAIASR